MKNEKMKRVAALALAGTMMASVVSPAAFADEAPVNTKTEPTKPVDVDAGKDEPDTTIDHVVETEKDDEGNSQLIVNPQIKDEDDSEKPFEKYEPEEDIEKVEVVEDGDVDPNLGTDEEVVLEVTPVEPTDPDTDIVIADGVLDKTETDQGNNTTKVEVEGEIKDEVEIEVPEKNPNDSEIIDNEAEEDSDKELIEEAEEVKEDVEDQLKKPQPAGEDAPDMVEEALEGMLNQSDNITTGQELTDGSDGQSNQQADLKDEQAQKQEEALKNAFKDNKNSTEENPVYSMGGFNVEFGETTSSQTVVNKGDENANLPEDINQQVTTTTTTTIKLTPNKLTLEEGKGQLEPAELEKVLDVKFNSEEPEKVTDPDTGVTSYIYTTDDGKKITVTDESTLATGTGWIIKYTNSTVVNTGKAEIQDTVDVTTDLEHTYSEKEVEIGCGSVMLPDRNPGEDAKNPTFTQQDIENAINAGDGEKGTVEFNGEDYTITKTQGEGALGQYTDIYTLTSKDGTVTYTIKKTPVVTNTDLTDWIKDHFGEDMSHIVTSDALATMDDTQIKQVLGDNYFKGEDGKIYYQSNLKDDSTKMEVAFETDAAIGQVVAVTVTKTDTHGAESGQKDVPGAEYTAENAAKNEAVKDALKDGLAGAAGVADDGTFTENTDGTLTYKTEDGKEYTFTPTSTGEWEVDVTGTDGIEKTYSFDVQKVWGTTSNSEKLTEGSEEYEEAKKELVANGVNGEDIASIYETTVGGSAFIQRGEITWTDDYEGELTGNNQTYLETLNKQIDKDTGKLTLTDNNGNSCVPAFQMDPENPAAVTSTTTWDLGDEDAPTFGGQKVLSVTVDANGRITEIITAGTPAQPKDEVEALGHGGGYQGGQGGQGGPGSQCGETVTSVKKTTYTFTYDQNVGGWKEAQIEAGLEAGLSKDPDVVHTDVDADLTKFTWSVTTQTTTSQDVTNTVKDKVETTGDIKEESTCTGTDGDLYVEFGTGCKTDKVELEKDSSGNLTASGDRTDVTVTEKDTSKDDTEIQDKIKDLLGSDATNINFADTTADGTFVVTYEKNGNTYTATYDAKDVTVEKTVGTKENVKQDNIATTVSNAYNSGCQIKEFEDYLDELEAEAEEKGETFDRTSVNLSDSDTLNDFCNYLAKQNKVTEKEETVLLEGQELENALSGLKSSNIQHDVYENGFNLQADLNDKNGNGTELEGTKSNLLLNTGSVVAGFDGNKNLTVEYGTAGGVAENDKRGDWTKEFILEDNLTYVGNSGNNHLEYSQSEGNDPQWEWNGKWPEYNEDHNWDGGDNGSYYHVTGTVAYTTTGADERYDRYNSYRDAMGAYKELTGEGKTAIVVNCGNGQYEVFEKTGNVNAYGVLDADSNNAKGGDQDYTLRLGNMAATDDGFVTEGFYKSQTSWSANLTVIQKKEGSVLTLENLKKETVGEEKKVGCGDRISGTYDVTQTLKVSDSWTHPEFAVSACDAVYVGEGDSSYNSYTEWRTTEDHYKAAGVQYGKTVTVEGCKVNTNDDLTAGFTNKEVSESQVKVTDKVLIEKREVDVKATIVTLDDEDGTGGGEIPETPETPEQIVTLVMNEVPVVEEIAETETPLAAPETEETVIEEEDTPLAAAPETDPSLEEIEDDEVALADATKTGDESGIFLLMSAVSGMALAVLSFIDRKGRHSRFGSQH